MSVERGDGGIADSLVRLIGFFILSLLICCKGLNTPIVIGSITINSDFVDWWTIVIIFFVWIIAVALGKE